MLRPHRPAPVVPLGGPILSAQQIQRRLERERIQQHQQQQHQVYGNLPGANSEAQQVAALMREVGEDATHDEALLALQSANWEMSVAVRQFKIERLVR